MDTVAAVAVVVVVKLLMIVNIWKASTDNSDAQHGSKHNGSELQ